MSENRCAACGGILPEGSQVCVSCYAKARDKGFEEGTRLAETAACCAADEAAKAYEELEEKHLSECRQISEYEQENRKLKEENKRLRELLECAVDHMNAIAENVREECGEAACGLCEFDSPMTEYGEMLYECPGCESRTDCFRWKRLDEVEELLGKGGKERH